MTFRLSIAQRLWAPTLLLSIALVLAGSITTVRTQALIRSAAAEQSAQLEKLVLALQWRGAVAAGDAPAATRAAESLRAHAADADEQRTLQAAANEGPQRLDALDTLVTLQRARLQALQAQAAEQRMRTVFGVLGLLAVIIALSGAGAAYLVRTVRRPLHQLGQAADRIGHGDLAVELDTSRPDEIGDLQRCVADMRDALRRLVGDMQRSAEGIRHASAEVAAGNMDLSARTETTAARLQQTAASMGHITQTVDDSAQAAGEARRLSGDAADVARRGGEAVGRVVQTMQGISESSRRIADITGVIDGIAFQTNILALNAAVEAARAGEQGRGFAVVAGEVRSLAQRSAEAAKEIKSLIGSSADQVEAGSRLVAEAGRTMSEIVAGVERVSAIVEHITDGGAEQARGVSEVDAAIGELDSMTQQNAALVEQSAAAAQSLNDQAQRLAQAVQAFRLAPAAA